MRHWPKAVFILTCMSLSSCFAAEEKTKTKEDFWDRTRSAAKRIGKGVKEGGKEVGRGFQEVFDPNDEDLQAERAKNKKK